MHPGRATMHHDHHCARTLRRISKLEQPALHVVGIRLPGQALRGPRRHERDIRARPLPPASAVMQWSGENLRPTVKRVADGRRGAIASDGELEEIWLVSEMLVLTPEGLHAAIVHRGQGRA